MSKEGTSAKIVRAIASRPDLATSIMVLSTNGVTMWLRHDPSGSHFGIRIANDIVRVVMGNGLPWTVVAEFPGHYPTSHARAKAAIKAIRHVLSQEVAA